MSMKTEMQHNGARASTPATAQTTADLRAGTPALQTDLRAGTPALPNVPNYHSRGYLPHIENKTIQTVTFRLADSVPRALIERWKNSIEVCSINDTQQSRDSESVKLHQMIETYEDTGCGECLLRDDRIAQIVSDALHYHNGQRYRLIRWCIMPNHVHVVLEVFEGYSLSTILQTWKSYSAHAICKLLARKGRIWMPEYFDRFVRSEEHLRFAMDYVDNNPVKAGLCANPSDWRWCGLWSTGVPARGI